MSFTILPAEDYPPALVETPTTPVAADLIGDLPPFLQGSTDLQAAFRAISNELARVEAQRQDLIANFFPQTADALLHFYEAMLNLSVDNPKLALVDRRAAVQAFLRRLRASSGRDWEETITLMIGNTWSYAEHDPADGGSPAAYRILLRLPFTGPAPVPSGLAASQLNTTGHLAAGTHYYAVTAVTGYGETLPSATITRTAAANETTHLTWTTESSPVRSFNVYRGTSAGALHLIGNVVVPPTGNPTYDDDGTQTLGVAPPMADTSASSQAAIVENLARSITPAHIAIDAGTTGGFIVGVSEVGYDAL